MPRGKSKKKKSVARKVPVAKAKAKPASKQAELELDLSMLDEEEAPAAKPRKAKAKAKGKTQKVLKEEVLAAARACEEASATERPSVLFPGVLPGPFEPNQEVLANGIVDLHALRSGLHLMILQAQAAIGAIEVLEYTQKKVQAMSKKEGE